MSVLTASYAVNADLLDGFDSTVFVQTGSYNSFTQSYNVASSSASSRLTNLEQFSSSLDNTYATDAQLNQATASLSGSIAYLSGSYLTSSASFDTRSSNNSASIAQLSSSFLSLSSSFRTGSFTGSFIGDGNGLYNIPASGIVGLNLSRIASGSTTASISPVDGFRVNTNTTITGSTLISGSLTVSGSTNIVGTTGTTLLSSNADTLIFTGSLYASGSVVITDSLEVNGRNYINDSSSFASRITTNSASFAVFSGSYINESSSFASRITTNSASFATFSGSYINESASFASRSTTNSASIASLSSSFSTFSGSFMTGSFTGSFTGSVFGTASYASQALTASYAATASSADDFTVRGTLTAQTIIAQTITSSIEYVTGSTQFGSLLSNTHQFTGSVLVTGSLIINGENLTGISSSLSSRITADSSSFSSRITTNSASFATFSGSYVNESSSFANRITTNSASFATFSSSYVNESASFESRITTNSASFASFSGSYINESSSFASRITINSSSFAVFSGSYINESSSFASRITTNSASFASFSGSYINESSSFASRITTDSASFTVFSGSYVNESSSFASRITTNSASFTTFSGSYVNESASFASRITTNSASFTTFSGSYVNESASFASRNTTNSASISSLSASFSVFSGSFMTGSFTGSFTGSLLGTASYANNANSSSYALTASYASNVPVTASYANNATSASYALTASYASNVPVTASYALTANTASYALNSDLLDGKDSSIFATTGSNLFIGNQIITGSFAITGSTLQIGNNTLAGNTILSGSVIISGSTTSPVTPTIKIYGDMETDGVIKFMPVNKNIDTSISASYIFVSGSTNDLYFSQNGNGYNNVTRLRWLEGNLYSGLLNGGLISQSSSTIYQVGSGSGVLVNLNASFGGNPYPTIKYLNWSNLSASIAPLSASYDQSFIAIDDTGNIFTQGTPYTDGQFNTTIPIGIVLHQNRSTINGTQTFASLAYGWKQRSSDFIRAFGPLKLSGLDLYPSSSLGLTVGSGTAWSDGRNYTIDPNNPSYITDSGTIVSKIFRYRQSGSAAWVYDTNGGVGYTTINPTQYSNSGSLASVGSGNWSIQRAYFFPNSVTKAIYVYYGNARYATEAEAIANLQFEPFVEAPNTAAQAVYLGAIIISGNGDFTNSNNYKFLPSGLFRSIGGTGGGGSSVTTTLAGLSDVNISGPLDHQPLTYNTTANKWINASTISASLAGNALTATSASYAQTASYVNPLSQNVNINGTLAVSQSLYVNKITGSLASGAQTISTNATGSYTSAFYNYTLSSGGNARAGQFMVVWNGSSIQYTDASTLDIGSTSGVALTASLNNGNVLLTTVLPTSGWTIKTNINFL